MCARSSSAMPLPLSLTAMETVSVEDWTLMPVAPPAYRSAFFEQVAHDPLHPPTINTGMDGVRSVGGDRRPLELVGERGQELDQISFFEVGLLDPGIEARRSSSRSRTRRSK